MPLFIFYQRGNVMFKTDTVAAISSAVNNSGISVIRISGEDAVDIGDKIFRFKNKKYKSLKDVDSHTVHYGTIYDEDKIIDEVLVLIMRAPNTYTKEDVVEIDCHGGIVVTKKILNIVIKNGARIAEPGEFTKRAFLNGRIDLSQAEAVMDVINAKNNYALKASVSQLRGSVGKKIKELRENIIENIAYIEAALDDPEHISMENYGEELRVKVEDYLKEIDRLIKSNDDGKIINEGIKTVILGKPNAGKSSLMNTLLGEERAIVTDVAGTTRDTLQENINISDVSLNIIDTAGIRDTSDVVEKIGVERSKKAAEEADLIIYVVDSSVELDENDKEIIKLISDKKSIVLLNKTDLKCIVTKDNIKELTGQYPMEISAKENVGIDKLKEKIKELFYKGNIDYNDEVFITNIRHKELLENARKSLLLVTESIDNDMPEDFFSIDLMNAYEELGLIIGEEVDDDLVNEIFAKFCMGK